MLNRKTALILKKPVNLAAGSLYYIHSPPKIRKKREADPDRYNNSNNVYKRLSTYSSLNLFKEKMLLRNSKGQRSRRKREEISLFLAVNYSSADSVNV